MDIAAASPLRREWRHESARQLLTRLVGVTQSLTSEIEPSRAYASVLNVVREVTGAERVSLQLLDESGKTLVLVAGLGLPQSARTGSTTPLDRGVAGWVLEHCQPLLVVGPTHPDEAINRLLRSTPNQSALCVPLMAKGVALGVVSASKFDPLEPFDEVDLDILALLAGQAATALAHARLYEQIASLSTTDELTGLLNHRAFQERLEAELGRAAHAQTHFALLCIDLDEFRLVNDRVGHAAGDRLLRLVAKQAIVPALRPYDVAGRTGGDEFGIILPHTSATQAHSVGEKIRAAVEKLDYALHDLPEAAVSASVGIAHFPSDGARRDSLQQAATKGLYYAKYMGRNQIQRAGAGVVVFESNPAKLQQLLDGASRSVVETLAAAVDARDTYTAGHSRRVADFVGALATTLGHGEALIQKLRLAALFHDVGKIGVADAILRKDGPLTDDEFEQMKRHPVIGADQLLNTVPFLHDHLPAIRHHHERWDGRGYPDGLRGEAIPYEARLLAVADAHDAMTSNRVYRAALPLEQVIKIFVGGKGTQWDPEITTAWLDHLSQEQHTSAAQASLAV